jgi:GT2 family glycosyltransferase
VEATHEVTDRKSVTIIVTQRERFSSTAESLASIFEHTSEPFDLIYVDGGSPAAVRQHLDQASAAHGFRILRRAHYVTQNQARNLALPLVTTPYICFIDNDMIAFDGWLSAMARCADETGAALVGPLYGIHTRADGHKVHTTDGFFAVSERSGRRFYKYRLVHEGLSLTDPDLPLARRACEQVEFHCMLVRTDVLRQLGGLDEGLRSVLDHVDLCLSVSAAGGTIWSEPRAVVSYLQPPPLAWADLPIFMLRWSEAWDRATCRRFEEKWDVHTRYDHRIWVRTHRSLAYDWLPSGLAKVVGKRAAVAILAVTVFPVETLVNRVFAALVEGQQRRRGMRTAVLSESVP